MWTNAAQTYEKWCVSDTMWGSSLPINNIVVLIYNTLSNNDRTNIRTDMGVLQSASTWYRKHPNPRLIVIFRQPRVVHSRCRCVLRYEQLDCPVKREKLDTYRVFRNDGGLTSYSWGRRIITEHLMYDVQAA